MVSLCSRTLALTPDLTAECTGAERGARVTALLPARRAATLCGISSAQSWRGSQSGREVESERDGFNHTNMHIFIHTGAVMPVDAQIDTLIAVIMH